MRQDMLGAKLGSNLHTVGSMGLLMVLRRERMVGGEGHT